MMQSYPDAPGFQNTATSFGAAESVRVMASTIREDVYLAIKKTPRACFEVEDAIGMTHQTVSARITELKIARRILDSGYRRVTPSGRKAIVWEAVE